MTYSDNWLNNVSHNKLLDGKFDASIKVGCAPRQRFNLRPLITTNGEIEEWHLLISDPPQIDWVAVSAGPKPMPGCPLATQSVIRFHPDDVGVSIDTKAALDELRTNYSELRYPENNPAAVGTDSQ